MNTLPHELLWSETKTARSYCLEADKVLALCFALGLDDTDLRRLRTELQETIRTLGRP